MQGPDGPHPTIQGRANEGDTGPQPPLQIEVSGGVPGPQPHLQLPELSAQQLADLQHLSGSSVQGSKTPGSTRLSELTGSKQLTSDGGVNPQVPGRRPCNTVIHPDSLVERLSNVSGPIKERRGTPKKARPAADVSLPPPASMKPGLRFIQEVPEVRVVPGKVGGGIKRLNLAFNVVFVDNLDEPDRVTSYFAFAKSDFEKLCEWVEGPNVVATAFMAATPYPPPHEEVLPDRKVVVDGLFCHFMVPNGRP